MKWFGNNREIRAAPQGQIVVDDDLAMLLEGKELTVRDALNVPAVAGCVELISSMIARLPIRMYEDIGGEVREIRDDYRLRLVNDETGDLLSAMEWKKAMIRDYLLPGGAYSYVDWKANQIGGIYYVQPGDVTRQKNVDPIFKAVDFWVGVTPVPHWQMMRMLRNTTDGVTGQGIVTESGKSISVLLEAMAYERNLVKSGARKGFLQTEKRLGESAVEEVKKAIKRLFSNESNENVVLLNSGIKYEAAGQTAVDAQLNENKLTNSREIIKMFCLSPKLFEGGATAEDRRISAAQGIVPPAKALQSACNRFLLLEEEKKSKYFVVDTDRIMENGMMERFQAYEIAIKNSIMQPDEVRYREDMSPMGLNFIKLGLDTVLYDPESKEIYTPNTDKTGVLGENSHLEQPKEVNSDEN